MGAECQTYSVKLGFFCFVSLHSQHLSFYVTELSAEPWASPGVWSFIGAQLHGNDPVLPAFLPVLAIITALLFSFSLGPGKIALFMGVLPKEVRPGTSRKELLLTLSGWRCRSQGSEGAWLALFSKPSNLPCPLPRTLSPIRCGLCLGIFLKQTG